MGLFLVALWLAPSLPCFEALTGQAVKLSAGAVPAGDHPLVKVSRPVEGTVFPPEMPPPLFRWTDTQAEASAWRIKVEFPGSEVVVEATVRQPQWRPTPSDWDTIKRRSLEGAARATIVGLATDESGRVVSRGGVAFATSRDEVGAPLFYREVNLPFVEAVKDPSKIRWRFGPIGSAQPPPVVLDRLPVCGNCHSFSQDGTVLGMDVDYANSKGSYVITRTAPEMALSPKDIITWDDYRREDGELTFGLLSQVSPDGNWVVSTVKDKSVFVPRPDLAFSQLFFPIKGVLALYHRPSGRFQALPGADDPAYVQSNPSWSPDGQYLVFARTKAYDLSSAAGGGRVLLTPDECREFLRDGKPFQFDLYRLPFNGGRGGVAEPLAGASGDGRSNFFPRYSPDGRWIVFCKASNYMLLQPDSELYIIPAQGGQARRLRANLARMNSWHSWSPNSRWLVFSSKAFSDYTQLCLTHIDEQGNSSPPAVLEHMTAPDRAANIPEFVNLRADGIVRIQEQFLNDYSFERAGNEFYRSAEPDRAIEQFRLALGLNPNNVGAHQRLGFLLYHVKREFAEGLKHTAEALRLDPRNSAAHSDMGVALLNQNDPARALDHFEQALRWLPEIVTDGQYKPQALRYHLGQACLQLTRFPEAAGHLEECVRLGPGNAEAHYLLALAWVCQGRLDDARQHYARAVGLRPGVDNSAVLHELFAERYAQAGQADEAIRSAEHALKLAEASGKAEVIRRIRARLPRYQGETGANARPVP
jgi:tetratricopeptide (TPR) repeat protein